jgi:hypothetical protein
MKSLLLLFCFLSVSFGNVVKSAKRSAGKAKVLIKRTEVFSTDSVPRRDNPRLNREDMAQLKILNAKYKKIRLDKAPNQTTNNVDPSLQLQKIVDNLRAANETTGLILSLFQNSSYPYINTTQIHNWTRLYRPSLLEYANDTASYLEDMKLIKNISLLTNPKNETRVISFALYGKKPKYNLGAIYNVEMAKLYFPGWKCRFYVTNDVLNLTINVLKDLGSEIEYIPPGMGKIGGMFWRFLVADDPKVDRYIVRDVDSRPNARDRYENVLFLYILFFPIEVLLYSFKNLLGWLWKNGFSLKSPFTLSEITRIIVIE